jgi:hypothetical protein
MMRLEDSLLDQSGRPHRNEPFSVQPRPTPPLVRVPIRAGARGRFFNVVDLVTPAGAGGDAGRLCTARRRAPRDAGEA